MAETLRQAKAFDLYYSLGANRSYEAVAAQIGVSKNSIYNWAKSYNWQERIRLRDKANAKELYKKTDAEVVDNLAVYRQVITASVKDYVKNLKNGKVKINSPTDFIKLVELDIKISEIINRDNNNSEEDTKTVINFNLTKK